MIFQKKKLHIVCLSILVLFVSCGKDKKTDFTYSVNNVGNITVEQGIPKMATYEVKLMSGQQQQVSITTAGLPAGVKVDFSPAVGTATFSTNATYTVGSSVKAGKYPFSIVTTTVAQADKSINAELTVIENCLDKLLGTYTIIYDCGSGTGSSSSTVTKVAGFSSRILVSDGSDPLYYADIDCATNTLVIPKQTIDGYTITGAGTFNTTTQKIDFTYTVTDGTDTFTCTEHLSK